MKDYSEHMHVYAISMVALIILNVGAYLIPDAPVVSVPMVEIGIATHHEGDIQ
jgi:hypothetical protein